MNTEDLDHGTSGNGVGIELANRQPPLTESELFEEMDDLFWATTVLDSELRSVGEDFINLFDVNTTNTHIEDNLLVEAKISGKHF